MKPEQPLLVYDGDCTFCVGWVRRCERLTAKRILYRSRQEMRGELSPELYERSGRSVLLIQPDRSFTTGAKAVFTLLAQGEILRWPLWLYLYLPGFSWVTEFIYRFVSENRPVFSALEISLSRFLGKGEDYVVVRWLLLRSISLLYFCAFISFALQIPGLIGKDGLLPATVFLSRAHDLLGGSSYFLFPTLCWINSSNFFLLFLGYGGAILSLLLFFDFLPCLSAFLLWLFYLSLVTVSSDFLSFQWDALLLEAGFLTILLAPWKWRGDYNSHPIPIIIWLFRFLIFRFIFFNGIVKVLSGDTSWRGLTALHYHFFTQPLPTVLGWWSNLAPLRVQEAATLILLIVELLLPWAIFVNRRLRLFASFGIIFLQILILLTGNYGFFNWLTIALAFSLWDDSFLRKIFPARFFSSLTRAVVAPSVPAYLIPTCVALVLVYFNVLVFFINFGLKEMVPSPFFWPYQQMQSFDLSNCYGAFAVMTKERPEIIIEGSDDGMRWKPYEFKYKPGDLNRAPVWVAPFQPRLDWQMWFAALSAPEVSPWLKRLLLALLKENRQVLALLKTNPFPNHAPRYMRAQLYHYYFTNLEERKKTGRWWRREFDSTLLSSFEPLPAHP